MKISPRTIGFTGVSAVLAAFGVACAPSPNDPDRGPDMTGVSKVPPQMFEAVSSGVSKKAIVLLAEELSPGQKLLEAAKWTDKDDYLVERRHEYQRRTDVFLDELPRRGFTVEKTFENLPYVFLDIESADVLDRLEGSSNVAAVYEDEILHLALAQSLPLIRQPETASGGMTGQGVSVAVLDTGADYTNAAFGSCTAPNTPSGTCKVVYAADIAPNDGSLDDNGHGTNVSAIVLGVAPSAKIVALDVFNGGSGSSTDLITALNWVISNRATYNIVAINMSLGAGGYTAPCTGSVYASALDNARAVDILSAVASGNDGYTSKISEPACIPSAVSVGAVYDANTGGSLVYGPCTDATQAPDQVTCFSNSASFLTMMAPGAVISAGGLSQTGTSQATPHVAGAIAVLRAARPTDTVSDTVARMVDNGVRITDPRNSLSFGRLDLYAAATDCITSALLSSPTFNLSGGSGTLTVTAPGGCAWTASSGAGWLTITGGASGNGNGVVTFDVAANGGAPRSTLLTVGSRKFSITQAADTTPPTGTVVINSGALYTTSLAVTLALSASDLNGVTQMCVSNTTTCTAWEAYATSKAWTLSGASGLKTVYVKYKDGANNVSASATTDTITYDVVSPTNGTVVAAGGDTQISVSWSGITDANSGIASYKLVGQTGTSPASCGVGTVLYTGTGTSFLHTGLTNGQIWYYRVCTTDRAGNTNAGSIANAQPAPEQTPPTGGSVVINSGATHTGSLSVTLTIGAASDPSGVPQMCVSNTTTCTAWIAVVPSMSWTLTAGSGVKTVKVWFRDAWNNAQTSPVSDTITADVVVPVNGTVTPVGSAGQVALTWTGFTDATSGIASYKVVFQTGSSPASCAVGTQIYNAAAPNFTHTGLTDGTTYYYRVCAIDNVGNVSTGATANARPAPEYAAPVGGSVSIGAGAGFTKLVATTLAISLPTDASGVGEMCVSNTTTCTAWVPAATSLSWNLTAGTGLKTVSVWFRDIYMNATTTAVTDTITLDQTLPVNGTVTPTPSTGQIALSFAGFTDANSGIASYLVVFGTASAPANCSTGTQIYSGATANYTHTGLTDGTTYYYRVCAVDVAGNISTGVTTSAHPGAEQDPPVGGSVVINGGAAYTKLVASTLTIGLPADASGVSTMCVSNTTSCTAWVPVATSLSWNLASGTGLKTVSVWFRDIFNNTTMTAVSDTITLDVTLPVNGTVTPTPSAGQIALSWSGYSDPNSGIASYTVVFATTAAPASCAAGTVVGTGIVGTSVTHTGLTNGTTYYYRVCAVDVAGNVSAGATTSAHPGAEQIPPTGGSVIINGGAGLTNSTAATLTIGLASDPSGLSATGMCVSNTTTCTAWIAPTTSMPWTLATGTGTKTVYVSFRDIYNNVQTTPVTDTISLDVTLPVNGTVTLTAASGQLTVGWSGFSDAHSGIASYKVVYGTTSPASCAAGTVLVSGTVATSVVHTGLTDGTTYYYRVCAQDVAGNMSAGATANGHPAPELTAPAGGSVVINGGAAYTKLAAVTLTINLATDASGLSATGMCVSNSATCSAWVAPVTSRAWTLAASTTGVKTVYVSFRDIYNNVSTAVTDTITVDATAPVNGTLTLTPAAGQIQLSWSGFSDAHSGLASYKVVFSTTASPASCAAGTQIYTGAGTSFLHTGLTSATRYYYRICATDNVGNTSTGAISNAIVP